METEFLI